MYKSKFNFGKGILFLCLFVAGCMSIERQNLDSHQLTAGAELTEELTPVSSKTEAMKTKEPESTKADELRMNDTCKLGLGLREETKDFILENEGYIGLIMASNSNLAEMVFPQFEESIRVLGAPSLPVLETKAMRARDANTPYEALGYGLETSASTPAEEWQNITDSTEAAEALGTQYQKQLLLAPGFRLMSQNENLYPEMASMTDIWILQTQQLQKNPPGPQYRQEVERIVSLIRSGNSEILIWAQITLPPDRKPNAEEWLAYRELIADLVDGTYIGVYTWDIFEDSELLGEIAAIYESACNLDLDE